MRRRFLRRKRTLLLCSVPFLLAGGISVFHTFEREREIFLHHLKGSVEKQLAHATGLPVRLERLKVGLFQETALGDLSFGTPGHSPYLSIRHTRFRKGEKGIKIEFQGGKLYWKKMALHDLEGELSLMKRSSMQLQGTFPEGGRITLEAHTRNPLAWQGRVLLHDFQWGEGHFASSSTAAVLLGDTEFPSRRFKIKVHRSPVFLNNQLLGNIRGRFAVSYGNFFIEKFEGENILSFSGKMSLSSPYLADGRLQLFQLTREKIPNILKDAIPSGTPNRLEGELFLNGPLKKVHLSGHLGAYEGRIKDIDYQRFMSTFQGHWPVVTVESRIERKFPEESYLTVWGVADATQLGKKGFYKTLALEGADALVWEGVSLQTPSQETLVVGKGTPHSSVSLKTFLNQEAPVEKEEEEFELEYRLRKDKMLKMRLKGDEEFMGLERKLSF